MMLQCNLFSRMEGQKMKTTVVNLNTCFILNFISKIISKIYGTKRPASVFDSIIHLFLEIIFSINFKIKQEFRFTTFAYIMHPLNLRYQNISPHISRDVFSGRWGDDGHIDIENMCEKLGIFLRIKSPLMTVTSDKCLDLLHLMSPLCFVLSSSMV